MNDWDTAREIVGACTWTPECDEAKHGCTRCNHAVAVTAALTAARREGAEEMRSACEEKVREHHLFYLADILRCLPVEVQDDGA